jgi:hypothetical protein
MPEKDNQTEKPELVLCYLTCPTDASNGFLGAVMVTDERTRPYHFSYVTAVRPSKMQRLLYGSTLTEHVKVDVISSKLLKGLSLVPSLILVDSPELVKSAKISQIPTAFVSKNEKEDNNNSLTGLIYDCGEYNENQEQVGKLLAQLETHVDLLDPFMRMREALKELVKSSE